RIKNIDRAGLIRPMASAAGCFREGAAQSTGGRELIGWLIALEDLANFEQCGVGESTVGVALCCRHQARDEAWPHVGQFSGDRIGKRQFRSTAAKKFGFLLGYE